MCRKVKLLSLTDKGPRHLFLRETLSIVMPVRDGRMGNGNFEMFYETAKHDRKRRRVGRRLMFVLLVCPIP